MKAFLETFLHISNIAFTKMFLDKRVHISKFLPLILFALVLACMEYDLLTVSAGEIRCLAREREALLKFKHGLIDEYGVLSSWGTEEECCKWKGVRCSNTTGHVTGLLLRGDDYNFSPIGGNITSSLLELHRLNHLDLSNNDFGGSRIPEFLSSIQNLEILNLELSNFDGMIPPQLGNLTNLLTLDLSSNNVWSENLDWLSHLTLLSLLDLSGANISDPSWLQAMLKLRSLQQLSLSGCMLTDVTPSADLFVNTSSSSLYILDLSNNKLTSSAFDWLFNLSTSLVNIGLSFNLLDGPIPDAFGRFIHLEVLDLSGNSLVHEIPKSLGSLSHLKSLYIFANKLGGSLEGLLGNQSCKVMSSLTGLHLSYNQIGGSIPELGDCYRLRYLDLGNNKLTGPIPSSLGNLSELEYLRLNFNSLQGTVTESHFLKLRSLKTLHLSYNLLTLQIAPNWIPPFQLDNIQLSSCKMGPSFPTWLQTQTNFTQLTLSGCGISDEAPKWLWSLSPRVTYFNISRNQIRGAIPHLSSSLIEMIDVSSNQLSGPFPLLHPHTSFVQFSNNLFSGSISSICSISYNNLVLLDLSNNRLEGALPDCWENMTQLIILNLNNNNLSGEIPHALGSLSNLQTLHLRNNNLLGELPSSLKNCGLLQLIDIGDNNLTGNIPSWLGASYYTSMTYLSIRENRFHGSIPLEICSLTQIQMLDLSRNNISGKLPHCFDNFTALIDKSITTSTLIGVPVGIDGYIDYALVQWKGQEAEYRATLGLLKLVDLSSNRLVGNIPKSFSKLSGLISLNLSRNSLAGNIDSNVGEMEMLECLDLSGNRLSGEIPIGLARLSYLAILDLANNNLSGKIPSSTQLQSFDESSYAGNDGLCGVPLELCPDDAAKPNVNGRGENTEEKGDGSMSLSLLQEAGISMAFGSILGFWGVVGTLVLKKSWRIAYFGFLDAIGNRMCVTTLLFLNKFK